MLLSVPKICLKQKLYVRDMPTGGWEGQEVKVPITFEPESIGTVCNTLTITGGVNGKYNWVLKGTATAPVPQVSLVGEFLGVNGVSGKKRLTCTLSIIGTLLVRCRRNKRVAFP